MSIATLRSIESQIGALLERHESGRDLSEFTRYADDPVGFIVDVLGAEPWSAQVEISKSVRDNPLTVVRSCNSMGKDWLAARLGIWWAYARGGLCLITSPSERQIKGIIFREIRSAFAHANLQGELFELALRVDRDSNIGIVGFTASSASALQGWHARRVLCVITEAQGVESFAYEAMHACATGPDDRMLCVGNPLHPSGEFYAITRRDTWHSIRVSAEEHPNVIAGRQVIAGGISQSFVDRMASEYGPQSSIYRSRILAEFPEFAEQGLLSRAWLERAAELYRDAAFEEESRTEEPVVAVDPARYGADSTGVIVRRGQRITYSTKWGQVSLTETAERLIAVLDQEGIRPKAGDRPTRSFSAKGRIVIDAHGLGAGLVDRLREYGYKCEEFLGMRRMSGDKFFNERSAAFWGLRELLENERLALEWDPYLVEELLSIEWSTPTAGGIQIVDKNQIKKLLGRSPDMADSLSMACFIRASRRARLQRFVV